MTNQYSWSRLGHGTEARARRHYREGEKPCEACRQAERQAHDVRAEARRRRRLAQSWQQMMIIQAIDLLATALGAWPAAGHISASSSGGASRAATELNPSGSVALPSDVAGGGATTSTGVPIPGSLTSAAGPVIHSPQELVHKAIGLNQLTLCDFCRDKHHRSTPSERSYSCLKIPCQCWCTDRDDKPLERP